MSEYLCILLPGAELKTCPHRVGVYNQKELGCIRKNSCVLGGYRRVKATDYAKYKEALKK